MAMIRNAEKRIVEQAKTHKELYCQQKTKLLQKKQKNSHRQNHFYILFHGIYVTKNYYNKQL